MLKIYLLVKKKNQTTFTRYVTSWKALKVILQKMSPFSFLANTFRICHFCRHIALRIGQSCSETAMSSLQSPSDPSLSVGYTFSGSRRILDSPGGPGSQGEVKEKQRGIISYLENHLNLLILTGNLSILIGNSFPKQWLIVWKLGWGMQCFRGTLFLFV